MQNKIRIISKAVHCEINLTADDWALYDLPGRDAAAHQLNLDIQAALAQGNVSACYKALKRQAEFGAADTEGFDVVYSILENTGMIAGDIRETT